MLDQIDEDQQKGLQAKEHCRTDHVAKRGRKMKYKDSLNERRNKK